MEKKRNLWVIPTDKPTCLYEMEGKFHLSDKFEKGNEFWHNQNIYITSDEEIKEGDWFMSDFNSFPIHNIKELSEREGTLGWEQKDLKNNLKIILTTDQDLIKDGVQEISEDFLQWFVKNPSCEKVETKVCNKILTSVIGGVDFYKIIIPQEEPKQDCECTDECLGYLTKNCKRIEQPKQETLEEVAERILANNIDGLRDALQDDDLFFFYKGVIQCYGEAMVEWQAERMYSEEEVIVMINEIVEKHCTYFEQKHKDTVKLEWFEQFKKK
jgi:hypothetical protein